MNDICKRLHKAGFQKDGNETMQSGITGEMLPCKIFIGPIFYQRLKHMVDYKWYARRRGRKNALTKQPNQGRKGGGGLRFGEMESNTGACHAVGNVLNDRMLQCSDLHHIYVCEKCHQPKAKEGCAVCNAATKEVEVPYAANLLFQELKSMNINVKLHA